MMMKRTLLPLLTVAATATALLLFGVDVTGQRDKQEHYLVGLLNYPNSFVPDKLQGHTSGTFIATPKEDDPPSFPDNVPFDFVPAVGFFRHGTLLRRERRQGHRGVLLSFR